jgi:hypothetical protein
MYKKIIPIVAIVLLTIGAACGSGQNLSALDQTLTPLSAAVEGTVTAQAANVGGADDKLATAYVKATATSASVYATETALGSLNDASRLATATAAAPVVAELPRYGIDPGIGHVAWLHKPVTIEVNGYQQTGFANDYQGITARDFVMAADISMHTFNSLSACGFMFRSNGNATKPTQYMVVITRYATGYMAFTATVNGEMSNMRTIYLYAQDKTFNWQNDAINRLAVVVRGQMIDAYTNGILVSTIDTSQPPPDNQQSPPSIQIPPNANPDQVQDYKNLISQNSQNTDLVNGQMATARKNFAKNKPILTEGLLGFINVSQSGQSKCNFSNGWLFLIER